MSCSWLTASLARNGFARPQGVCDTISFCSSFSTRAWCSSGSSGRNPRPNIGRCCGMWMWTLNRHACAECWRRGRERRTGRNSPPLKCTRFSFSTAGPCSTNRRRTERHFEEPSTLRAEQAATRPALRNSTTNGSHLPTPLVRPPILTMIQCKSRVMFSWTTRSPIGCSSSIERMRETPS